MQQLSLAGWSAHLPGAERSMRMVVGRAASRHPQQLPLVQRCRRMINPGAPRPKQAARL